MKKLDIWMPLYIAEYAGDTMHLTTEQHGAYILLLMHAWRNRGYLQVDDQQLASVTKMTLDNWKANAFVLLSFWKASDKPGFLTQKRLLEEIQRATRVSDQRSTVGRLGGRPKKQLVSNSLTNANLLGKQLRVQSQSQSHIVNTNKEGFDFCESHVELKIEITPEVIYEVYPQKVGRPAALKAILRQMKNHCPVCLLEKTKALADLRAGDLDSFPSVPHPSTWFNQERFNDNPETWKVKNAINGSNNPKGFSRNQGTFNEGNASQYRLNPGD